ncbi:MAG: substrate-binding domain-containing protein [Bacteroidota bacterium]|nr:substrate-binding domain-containing protein [Bacteroidota bacterium]
MNTLNIIKAGLIFITLFYFTSCKEKPVDLKKEITITGSESEKLVVQYLANQFAQLNKGVNIIVKGGGSEYGIIKLKDGDCDIANSSRVFDDADYAEFKKNNVKQAIIAVDAIAIVTHPSLGMDKLSLEQLSGIYAGRIKNWKEIGGPDLDILPIGRKTGSGTRLYMQHRLNIEEFSPMLPEFKRYEEIIAQVAKNKNAIGYVSLEHALSIDGRPNASTYIMPVSIDGVEAKFPYDKEAISYGDYPLIRPLFQYYHPGQNEYIEKFIQFELSDEGQRLLQKIGYYPINDFHKQINKVKM